MELVRFDSNVVCAGEIDLRRTLKLLGFKKGKSILVILKAIRLNGYAMVEQLATESTARGWRDVHDEAELGAVLYADGALYLG